MLRIKEIFGLTVLGSCLLAPASSQAAVTFGKVLSYGEGCPQSSIVSVHDPMNTTYSTLLDRFRVEVSSPGSEASKSCQLFLPVTVVNEAIVRFDLIVNGNISVKPLATATYQIGFDIPGSTPVLLADQFIQSTAFEIFHKSSSLLFTSGCGRTTSTTLRITADVSASVPQIAFGDEFAMLGIDSFDTRISSMAACP